MGEGRTIGEEGEELARRYHDPRYLGTLADILLGIAVLALVAFTPPGQAADGSLDSVPEAFGAFLPAFR